MTSTLPSSPATPAETTTRVVCLRRRQGRVVQGCDVYIGRACSRGGWTLPCSVWHNPFTVGLCGSAEEAVRQYEAYILQRTELLLRLPELRGKVLGCWCKKTGREPCHGDVLVRLIDHSSS